MKRKLFMSWAAFLEDEDTKEQILLAHQQALLTIMRIIAISDPFTLVVWTSLNLLCHDPHSSGNHLSFEVFGAFVIVQEASE